MEIDVREVTERREIKKRMQVKRKNRLYLSVSNMYIKQTECT